MAVFETGKRYKAGDCGISSITIIKRTAKTCLVENDEGIQWRMLIRNDGQTEMMADSAVPSHWRGAYTYYADHEERE